MAKIACLAGPEFEDSELAIPVKRLRDNGHQVEILGIRAGEQLEGKKHTEKVTTDAAVTDRHPDAYDALLIPGGRSPAHLRRSDEVINFVRDFAMTGRPIAAICHGPQLLIDARMVGGVRMTAWPSVRAELLEAGAEVQDAPVVEDRQFITSRNPGDLDVFSSALLARLRPR